MNLEKILKYKKDISVSLKPQIFDLQKPKDRTTLAELMKDKKIRNVSDDYEEQLREHFAIMNSALVFSPDLEATFQRYMQKLSAKVPLWQHGRWIYFPWNGTLVHILEDREFQQVRMARNRELITEEEQKKFYDSTIGIAGLSVGNSVALAIVLSGGARYIKLADLDHLALSNINRIRTGIDNLGLLKTEITAREIYTINPYAEIELFPDGLHQKNIERFFHGRHKLDIIIDEIDNLAVKYLIREYARKYKLPVVMAADNGDSAVIDIERYDLNPKTLFFHGRMGKTSYEELSGLDKRGIGRKIAGMVGIENHTERMLRSLTSMGKTIVSWPQLGGTALLNGAAVAYCVRRILNNQPLERDRAIISLDEKLIPNLNTKFETAKRKKVHAEFRKIFGS